MPRDSKQLGGGETLRARLLHERCRTLAEGPEGITLRPVSHNDVISSSLHLSSKLLDYLHSFIILIHKVNSTSGGSGVRGVSDPSTGMTPWSL